MLIEETGRGRHPSESCFFCSRRFLLRRGWFPRIPKYFRGVPAVSQSSGVRRPQVLLPSPAQPRGAFSARAYMHAACVARVADWCSCRSPRKEGPSSVRSCLASCHQCQGTEVGGRFVVAGAKDGKGYNKNKAIKMIVEATILASE